MLSSHDHALMLFLMPSMQGLAEDTTSSRCTMAGLVQTQQAPVQLFCSAGRTSILHTVAASASCLFYWFSC